MRKDLFRGVVLGAIVSTVVLIAAAAVAGTGVGAVFNLGKSNSVNAQSTLKGSTTAKNLQIINTGSGGALGIKVKAGKPPIVVNASAGKATNLNADKLDGLNSSSFVQGFIVAGSSGGVTVAGLNDYIGVGARSSTVENVELIMPTSGTITQLSVHVSIAPGATNNITFNLLKNGTLVSGCSILDLGTSCASSTTSIVFSAGDLVVLQVGFVGGMVTFSPVTWSMKIGS